MTSAEALEWLRSEVNELRSRRPRCADKSCTVCKRFAVEDRHTDEALAALEALAKLGAKP